MLVDVGEDRTETTLVTHVILARVFVEHKLVTVFVYCIVRQVHAQVVQVAAQRRGILLGCESREPFFVDESPKGCDTGKQHINAEVKFEVVDEVWFVKIALSHVVFPSLKPVKVSSQENAFALAAGFGLDDEGLGFLDVKLRFEIFGVLRQQPGFGEEVVVLWERFLHCLQVLSQEILPC